MTAFTFGFAAPQVLCDIALAQGVPSRNRRGRVPERRQRFAEHRDSVSRSVLLPARRPTIAVPAGSVLQIGADSSNVDLGLHPRLTGLKSIFDAGRLAIVQRTGYANQSRSHFTGFDIWGTASTTNAHGTGWLGRYLDQLPSPGRSAGGLEHAARNAAAADGQQGGRAGHHEPGDLFASRAPTPAPKPATSERRRSRIASHVPVDRPHLAFVNSTTQAALSTLDRVATVAAYRPSRDLPEQRLRPGAAGRGRRDEQADRHQGVLGADRRIRHARRRKASARARTST